jgi:hypothetical protein
MSGFSDFEVVYKGRVGYLEFKSDKGVVSDDQSKFMEGRKRAGCPCRVARSVKEGVDFLVNEMGVPVHGRAKESQP